MTIRLSINYFLAPLEVGHEVDTVAKALSFVNLSLLPTLSRTFRPVQRKNSAKGKK
jgi:hypothetical protein